MISLKSWSSYGREGQRHADQVRLIFRQENGTRTSPGVVRRTLGQPCRNCGPLLAFSELTPHRPGGRLFQDDEMPEDQSLASARLQESVITGSILVKECELSNEPSGYARTGHDRHLQQITHHRDGCNIPSTAVRVGTSSARVGGDHESMFVRC